MKKTSISLAAALLTAATALNLCIPANAAGSITVNNSDADHKYEAYQILAGSMDESGAMNSVAWGANLKGDDFLTAIQKTADFKAVTDVDTFLDTLETVESKSDSANTVAKIAGANLTGKATALTFDTEKKVYTATGLEDGYYLVKDADDSQKNGAYTLNLLTAVGNDKTVAIKPKADVPSIGKKIGTEYKTGVEANTASIGDKVPYVLESKVPDMTGYNKYFFVVNDTLHDGLTFNDDVTVTIGDKALGEDDYYVNADGQNVKIVIKDFIQYKENLGDTITFNYTATLNEKADRTVKGNDNKVNLTYSNNPNFDYEGKPGKPGEPGEPGNPDEPANPDEPGENEPVGKTPDVVTKTYTTGIGVIKIDGKTKERLTGAKFSITGDAVNTVITVAETYTESADGKYYQLKGGSYTDVAPADGNAANYASDKKYALTTKETKSTKSEEKSVEASVDAQGYLTFEGLGAGTYVIKETEAPKGYNKSEDEVKVVIADGAKLSGPNWTVTIDGAAVTEIGEPILANITVENNKGIILPSTGGIGTTVFYIVGSVLMVGAAGLFVSKKVRSKEQ